VFGVSKEPLNKDASFGTKLGQDVSIENFQMPNLG
jgi:hypothetical protein